MDLRLQFDARVTVAAAILLPALASAQTNISGFVKDSLSGRPLAGATVQLVPSATPWAAGRMVRSDSIGRFSIDTVAPGQYLFGFQHPRLDSLGMDAVNRTLVIVAGIKYQRADLAVPSGRSFVTMLCGGGGDSTGAVIGRVMNADDDNALAGGTVVVRFAQMRFDNGGVRRVPTQLVSQFSADGKYVVCGIPTDAPITAQARMGTGAETGKRGMSGEIELTFAPRVPLIHRDLLIALRDSSAVAGGTPANPTRATIARTGTARLSGRVTAADGQPVNGARVSVQDADISATTDSSGTFRAAGLPSGTRAVEVTAIGYTPVRASADLRPTRETVVQLSLGPKVATLGAVNVTAKPDRAGFSQRRTAGLGYFIDAKTIEARGSLNIASAIMTAPSLRTSGFSPRDPSRPRITGRNNCTPAAFVDGQPIPDGLTGVDDMVQVRRVGGIEIYSNAAEAPPQFRANGNCAVVVIWSRSYVP